jgi:hypothetical protein
MTQIEDIIEHGPRRVMLTSGATVAFDQAMDIVPSMVFVRNDGWSVGCTQASAHLVVDLWDWSKCIDLRKLPYFGE